MEIVLVRHAQPDWEPADLAVDDPGLTPLGRDQARRAAVELEGLPFDHFYASPLRRVTETVVPIREQLGLEPQVVPWLREMALPSLEGQTAEQVQTFFRTANARNLDSWWDGVPGGESYRHFYERVARGVESLLCDNHDVSIHTDGAHRLWRLAPEREHERILIAAHEDTNAALLSHLLGVEPVPWAWVRFSTAWAGISVIKSLPVANGMVWALDSFNRTHHLRTPA